MTTAVEAGIGLLESELLPDIRAHADALDRDEDTPVAASPRSARQVCSGSARRATWTDCCRRWLM